MVKPSIESLVSWTATGAILVGIGLYMFIRAWLTSHRQLPLEYYRGAPVDPSLSMGGGLLAIVVGLLLIAFAIIGKLRRDV